jgi:DNA-binding response OmpR family regulator
VTANAERILLVEDDAEIRRELMDALRGSGFSVLPAATYREAEAAFDESFSLVVLDLWLPDRDGLDLCRQLRYDGSPVPVVIITARDEPDEIVRGLDVGADDYVTKPFRVPELLARIRSVLRRASPPATRNAMSVGTLMLNTLTRRATLGGESLSLKPREFDLLAFFMRYPGRVWTRSQLLARVWGPQFEGDDRTVDLHVARLRAVVEKNPRDPEWIETVWRVGYRFRDNAP